MGDSRETSLTKAFVAGYPVRHSRSPLIHKYWIDGFGLAGDYCREEIAPDVFQAFLAALKEGSSGYVGGNVTIPHKETAYRHADQPDNLAGELGAANTLWMEEGLMRATNTDGYGFLANLDDRSPGWDRSRDRAVILGAGGASRAVIQAVRDRGFAEIHVLNRTVDRARELADRFGHKVHSGPIDAVGEVLTGANLFVNTTSLGMHGNDAPDLDFTVMHDGAIVTDIVYVPLVTPFLKAAENQGIAIVDGLGMLLNQAVPGFERWFGRRPVVSEELRALVIADMDLEP